MPKEIKPPDFVYGSDGAFGYYQALLKPILQYPVSRMEWMLQ